MGEAFHLAWVAQSVTCSHDDATVQVTVSINIDQCKQAAVTACISVPNGVFIRSFRLSISFTVRFSDRLLPLRLHLFPTVMLD